MHAQVQLPDGTVKNCVMTLSTPPDWTLQLSGIGLEHLKFRGNDLFESMIALRGALEEKGCRLLCARARVDVFPSGMSRDMSGGQKAYITRIGKETSIEDLVDIFAPAEPQLVGTVEQQRAFHERWLASVAAASAASKPLAGEIEEAKRHPNGWVYRITGHFRPEDDIPPDAIVGAWKVDEHGAIVGDFIKNAKYDPKRWPTS